MKYEFSISYSVGDSFSKDSFLSLDVWNAYSFLQCRWNKYIERRDKIKYLNSYYKGNEDNQTNKRDWPTNSNTAQAATAHNIPLHFYFHQWKLRTRQSEGIQQVCVEWVNASYEVAELHIIDTVNCPSQVKISLINAMKTAAFSLQIQICKLIVMLVPSIVFENENEQYTEAKHLENN